MTAMTKEQFKQRWESNDEGGGINFEDIAKCAVDWGIYSTPKTKPMNLVRYKVLVAAQTVDCEDYKFEEN